MYITDLDTRLGDGSSFTESVHAVTVLQEQPDFKALEQNVTFKGHILF